MSLKISIVPVTKLQQNCTFITDQASGQTAIVDPGGDVDRIIAALAAQRLEATEIWLTHGHLDHAGGAAELAERLNAQTGRPRTPIIGPDRRDEMLLSNIVKQGQMFGLAGLRDVVPDRWLAEGDRLQLGQHVFDVLHCPGHTPGHVVFICKAARFAQLGDVLFRGSIGRTDFPYGDHAALINAITSKLLPLGDDMEFVCGHGPGSSLGAERASNPFL
jgi:glyoxylase-like metal-dependent hydrolase (beta-lactamase superfamily II)